MKLDYEFDFEKEIYYCKIHDDNGEKVYVGKAVCHPEDKAHRSDKVGFGLASLRAELAMKKDILKQFETENTELYKFCRQFEYTYTDKVKKRNRIYNAIINKKLEIEEIYKIFKESIQQTEDDISTYLQDIEKAHNAKKIIDKKKHIELMVERYREVFGNRK